MNDIILPNELTLQEVAEKANEQHSIFMSSARTTVIAAWTCGGYLLLAKSKTTQGSFLEWLRDNFNGGERSAQNYMRIHAKVPESALSAEKGISSCLKLLSTTHKENIDYSERDAKLISRGTALPNKRYNIIIADPPWRYEHAPAGDPGRAIEAHYPTMSMEELADMQILDIAAPDCLLYLWATTPKLAEAMWLIKEWGFVYTTNLVWVKDKIGTGYHARGQHELILIAKLGGMPPPAPELRRSSVIFADRESHSEKPTELYERIEEAYQRFPKIELFSRTTRNGWDNWGYEAIDDTETP
jgi:N6-adenosine-specific RNA methylase IME4